MIWCVCKNLFGSVKIILKKKKNIQYTWSMKEIATCLHGTWLTRVGRIAWQEAIKINKHSCRNIKTTNNIINWHERYRDWTQMRSKPCKISLR